jgi:hypothetical protein
LDVYAYIEQQAIIKPGERVIIGTGVVFDLEKIFEKTKALIKLLVDA